MALLVAARAVHLAATLSLAGALAFRLLVAPFPLRRLALPSLALALLAGAAWLVLQSREMAGTDTVAETLAAVPVVALHTRFGVLLLLRLGALLLAGALAARWHVAAALCAAIAVGLQAGLGHAAAEDDPLLVVTLVLHLLAVAAWLGGLAPLWMALGGDAPGRVARRFSLYALLAVAVIVATGLEQAARLIGGMAAFTGTAYGRMALVKIGFLLVLLGIAAVNRFAFTPALGPSPALRRLRLSLAVEIGLGLCVIAAATTLASLPPAIEGMKS